MTWRLFCRVVNMGFFIWLFALAAVAQTGNDLNQGLQSFSKYDSTDVDSVNVTNAGLSVHIPLWSYPQRGGTLHLGLSIFYNGPTLHLNTANDGDVWEGTGYHQRTADVIWNARPGIVNNDVFVGTQHTYYYSTPAVVDPDGAQHKMGAIPNGGNGNLTQKLYAADASGYYIDSTNPNAMVLYDSHGNKYAPSGGVTTATDTNGNRITFNADGSITDTINRSLPAVPVTTGCSTMQIPGQAGGHVPITLCYSSGQLSSVQLPNGTSYQFTYESFQVDSNNYPCGVCTELKQITLPTGGTISYTWETHETLDGLTAMRTLTTRTVNDGTGNKTWTYAWGSSGSNRTITVVDPLNQKTVHTAQAFGSAQSTWQEIESDQKDNNNSLLKTTTTSYTGTAPSAVLPTTVTTIWPTNQQKKQTRQYGATFTFQQDACLQLPCHADTTQYTGYVIGNPITVTDSDYGNGAPGGTLRTTTTIYEAFPNNSFNNVCPNNYCTSNLLNLKQSETVTDPGHSNTAISNYSYDSGTKGNLLSISRLQSGSNYITTDSMTYYSTGMLETMQDALLNTTQYFYDGTGLFLSHVQDALGHQTSYNYDANTGVLNYVIDSNQQQTSYTYDSMNRIKTVSYPDNGSTTYTYNDSPNNSSVVVTEAIASSLTKTQTAIVDGLGRVVHTQLTSDPEGQHVDYVDTAYDALGRKSSVTNPYRSGDTIYSTQYQYDALGRITRQTQPGDNSYISYSYSGNTTTVTDEAGKSRKALVDGLDRLTKVWEDPSGLNYETDYAYDCLSNLTSVLQSGSRSRTFTYDSLSRLLTASNPETGTVRYGYDNDSVLTSKTDARNITITYHPDALHRITSKTYSNGEQAINYCYDNQQTACGAPSVSNGIGRRTGMSDASGNTARSYDVVGRTSELNQTVTGYATGITDYQYNLDGSVAQINYPTGDKVQYTYSTAGRVTEVDWTGIGVGLTLASNIKYTAAGAISSYTNGDGASITRTYNSRLQPATMQASGVAGNFFSLTYNFNPGHDNGDVVSVTDNVRSQNQSFTYDSLNRLATANFYGGSDQYGYDAWGNLTSKTVTGGTGEIWSMAADGNNRIAAYDPNNYDAAGNLTYVSGLSGSSTFNAENQLSIFTGTAATFLYDGDGTRVRFAETSANPEVTYYWNDKDGAALAETDAFLNIHNVYFYLNGERIAYAPQQGAAGVYFYYDDYKGNVRVITDKSQNVCFTSDYFPWGGYINATYTNTCPTQYRQFDGKDRDPIMGVDYFEARYYKQDMGRFYSPDWSADVEPVPYAKLDNPQTLNLYTYVADNPTTLRDPDGHDEDPNGVGGASGPSNDSDQTVSSDTGKADAQKKAQNQECKYSACVTAQAPKVSIWRRMGGWLGGAALGIVRWGKLGGPLHRAGIDRISRSLEESGFRVQREVRIPTPNGAKSSRWVDVVGTRDGEVRMYQIGKQNQNGTPVAREAQALDDIEEATGIRPTFVPYNVGEPNLGVPAATDVAPGQGVAPGEGEVPAEPEIIPE